MNLAPLKLISPPENLAWRKLTVLPENSAGEVRAAGYLAIEVDCAAGDLCAVEADVAACDSAP